MNTISINIPPNTKYIDKIIKLDANQLQKVLEMGYSVYTGAVDNIYKINNNEYNTKIQEIKQFHNIEVERKNKEIIDLTYSIKQIQKNNNKNQELMLFELKNKLQLQFSSDIEYKNSKINELINEIEHYKTNIRNLDAIQNQHIERIIRDNKTEINEIRDKCETKIEELYKKMTSMQTLSDNSYYKGKVGEQKMLQVLTLLFPKNEIIDTHCDPNRGDFLIVCDSEKKILIDNKDYNSNVPKKEIDKFHKDIENNIDVHSGILISNSSGIARKDDFEIDIVNNKPVIYLCNTNKNQEKIKLAADFLKSLMKCNNIDFSNKEIIDKIKKLSTEFKRKINKIKKDIEKFSSSLQNTVLDIEDIVKMTLAVYKL